MNPDWMEQALQAALQAGRRILALYTTDFNVEHKSDRSPVTIADRQADAMIRSILMPSALPILSEEGRDIPFGQRKSWDYYWLVDPLDGTKEFIKRNGEFTVNIALMAHDAPVAGIVYAPVPDRLYFGERTSGAYRLDNAQSVLAGTEAGGPNCRRRLIAAAKRLPDRPAPPVFTVAGSRSHATDALAKHLAHVRAEKQEIEFISAGSSLKFCLVAEGSADQYPRLGPTMEWDTAAGQAVAEAAGARVLEYENRHPLRYNKESLLNPWFIVERQSNAQWGTRNAE